MRAFLQCIFFCFFFHQVLILFLIFTFLNLELSRHNFFYTKNQNRKQNQKETDFVAWI